MIPAILARLLAMPGPLARIAGASALAATLGWWGGGAHQHREGFRAGVASCEAANAAAAAQVRHRHRDIIEEARNAVNDSERGLDGPDDVERLCAEDPACPND